MSKDRRNDGRRFSRAERALSRKRRKRRADAWRKTDDGAGPRDIDDPKRHHR